MFPQVVIPLLEKCGLKDVAVEVNSGKLDLHFLHLILLFLL